MKDVKEMVRSYFHLLFNEKDPSVSDELLAQDYIDHDAPERTPPGPALTAKNQTAVMDLFEFLHKSNVVVC